MQGLDDAVDRGELCRERRPVALCGLLGPVRGQLAPDVRLDLLEHVRVGAAEEPFRDLGLGQLPAELGQQRDLKPDRDALAVDEHAVTVEDH